MVSVCGGRSHACRDLISDCSRVHLIVARKDARLPPQREIMKPRDKVAPQRYERTLLELCWERKSENTRIERLSAILAKKSAAKAATPPDRVA